MDNIRTRIDTAKQYVKDHALEVTTAVSSVVTALAVIKIGSNLNRAYNLEQTNRARDADMVAKLIEQDRGYTYLPGVGVHIHKITSPSN